MPLALLSFGASSLAAQTVSLTPATGTFTSQVVGSSSAAKVFTLKNGLANPLTISSVAVTGDFQITQNNCPLSPATLAASKSCTISVVSQPSTTGTRTGSLTVTDDSSNSPQVSSLTGTGTNGVTTSPSSLSFASLDVGGLSAPKTVTFKNVSTAPVTLTSVTISGDFQIQSNSCPLSPSTLAAGASCTVPVVFAPLASGARSGTLSFNDNVPGSPQLVSLTGSGVALTSISVSPASPSISKGATVLFTATGKYSGGSTLNVSSQVIWSSSSSAVASISNSAGSQGLATALAQGTSTITATFGLVVGSTILTVSPPALVSLSVTPANSTLPAGASSQFTVTGTYSDSSTQNLTASSSWTSSNPAVATIGNSGGNLGLAQGVTQGTATISASFGGLNASTTLTVGPPALASLAIAPSNPSIALGTSQQLTATGTFTDGSSQNLTAQVIWFSSSAVATVSNDTGTQGFVTSASVGVTTLSATSGAINASVQLAVTPATLVSIAVTPAIPSIGLGANQQFTATGTFTDGSSQNITNSVQWSSSIPAVATISNAPATPGLALSTGTGSALITAASGAISGSTTLTVTPATLVSIALNPPALFLTTGVTQQMSATGTFTDGSAQDITATVAWTTSDPTIAVISPGGLVTPVGNGAATITATVAGISGHATVSVGSTALVSISVSPAGPSIPLGMSQQFTATGTFSDSSTQDLTTMVYWTSSAPAVATVSDSLPIIGLASSGSVGSTTITASSGSVSGSAQLTVSPAALVSISIAPQNPSIPLGSSQQFAATGFFTDGSSQDLTSTVTWTSSTSAVAVASNAPGTPGLVTSAGTGTASITATFGTVSASTSLTVSAPQVVSISLSPLNSSVVIGTFQQFTALGTYTDGSTLDVSSIVAWNSSNSAVAGISAAGLASTFGVGSSIISATLGSALASTILVVDPQLLSILVAPAHPSIIVGTSQQFSATGTFTGGLLLDVTAASAWSSSNPAVATINSAGLATASSPGTTTITASDGVFSNSTLLSVSPPPPSYTLTASPLAPNPLTAGNQTGATITLTPANGYTGTINLSCSPFTGGVPSPTCTFGLAQLTITGPSSVSTSLTLSSSIATPGGSYSFSVSAADSANLAPSNGPQPLALTIAAVIQHIIVIFQENRTPDNLFQDPVLIARGADIANSGVNSQGQTIPLAPINLGTVGPNPQSYDLDHSHAAFVSMYDGGKMDGADKIACAPPANCPENPQFKYVLPSDVQPYFNLAEQYTFGDRMFQTNEGPSFPAHQFIISGTSAPSTTSTLFAAENPTQEPAGCTAPPSSIVAMVDANGVESKAGRVYPCFEHPTLTDLLNSQGVSWRYYAPTGNSVSIWIGPNAIQHMCQQQTVNGILTCTGPDWTNNVVIPQTKVLTDIATGNLAQVTWVIPAGTNSDHANSNKGAGPSWVTSIVNAVGNSPYWANTAIIITWDDWGGWYDHVAPKVINDGVSWGSGYVYGFRVPLIVVSPYAKTQYISHVNHDFGSIIKFVETTFNLPSLGYADSSADDFSDCFIFTQSPTPFHTVPATLDAAFFLHDKTPPTDPDDDY